MSPPGARPQLRITLHNAATQASGAPWPRGWHRERDEYVRDEAEARSWAEQLVNAGDAQAASYTVGAVTHTYTRGRGWSQATSAAQRAAEHYRWANRPDRSES